MNNYALVSVITLTRNRANLLKRAIKSVLSQSFTDYEYIIVDGASDDNTEEIVMSFCDKRITYIKQLINKSTIESMEDAIKIANGKYITFLDDDDEYLQHKLDKQVQLFNSLSKDYGFIYCWMNYLDNRTGSLIKVHKDYLRGFVTKEIIDRPECLGGTPSLMFLKEAFLHVGGWSKELLAPSDWELKVRSSLLYKVDYCAEILVNVYVNHDYLRQSNNINLFNTLNMIQLHEYFLNRFKETFTEYPSKARYHLFKLIKYSCAVKNFTKFIHYFYYWIRINYYNIIKYKLSISK
ncbi:MAG: glycosyltransferase family 2 protein [Ignavibacteriaceae bacterium]